VSFLPFIIGAGFIGSYPNDLAFFSPGAFAVSVGGSSAERGTPGRGGLCPALAEGSKDLSSSSVYFFGESRSLGAADTLCTGSALFKEASSANNAAVSKIGGLWSAFSDFSAAFSAGEVKLRYSVAGLLLRVYFEGAGAEAIGDFCAVEAVAMVGDVFVEDASGFVGDDMVAVKRCGLVNRCFTGIVAEGVISSRDRKKPTL
jgi:hypothetical protein